MPEGSVEQNPSPEEGTKEIGSDTRYVYVVGRIETSAGFR